jgi:histidinol-phosphate aminotransferase
LSVFPSDGILVSSHACRALAEADVKGARICRRRLLLIEPRPEVQKLPRYSPGRGTTIDASVINLAANESAWGSSPRARAAWLQWDDGARYPDMAGLMLKERLAARWGVPDARIILGTGSGHLIKCLAEAYLRPGDRVATLFPTFSLYAQGAALMGAQVRRTGGRGHQVHLSELGDLVAAEAPRLVFLCSPNNPTGDLVPAAVLRRVLEVAGPDTLVVVDEAYRDFAEDGPELAAWLDEWPTLALLRTLSKAYGLAAHRVGALIADATVVDAVSRVREPFPVSGPALAAGAAAVDDEEHRRDVVAAVLEGRRRLQEALRERGWRVNPSQGNFVWTAPPAPWRAEALRDALLARGVLIRHGGSFGVADHVRITIGRPEEEQALLEAIDAVVGSGAPRLRT